MAEVTRKVRKDVVRNRQLLLHAARTVFAERGLDASLDDVARAAGVGVGTAYRHFANKHELAAVVLHEEIGKMLDLVEHLSTTDDPWAGLTRFVTSAVQAQVQDRGLRDALTGVHDQAAYREINARFNRSLGVLVDRAKDQGTVRADVAPSDLGMVVEMLCTVDDLAGRTDPALWQRYLPMLLHGLTADVQVDVPALSEADFRDAMDAHKTREARDHGAR